MNRTPRRLRLLVVTCLTGVFTHAYFEAPLAAGGARCDIWCYPPPPLERWQRRIRRLLPGPLKPWRGAVAPDPRRYDALVILRSLEDPLYDLFRVARDHGVPSAYFVDDNFFVMQDAAHLARDWHVLHAEEYLRRMREQDLILCSTEPLRDYLRSRVGDTPVAVHGPAIDTRRPVPPLPALDDGLRLVHWGGVWRAAEQAFIEPVLLTLRERHPDWQAFFHGPQPADARFRAGFQPFEGNYRRALARCREQRPHLMLCPLVARPENVYKSLIKCLDAVQIGALPLLSDTPPYTTLAAEIPELSRLLVDNEPAAWVARIESVAADLQRYRALYDTLVGYVTSHHSAEQAGARLLRLIPPRGTGRSRPEANGAR